MKVWLGKFFAQYGPFFVIIYLLAFFGLVTLGKGLNLPAFPGDVQIATDSINIYLPFTGALAFAIFVIIIFGIYKGLKSP